MDFRKPCITFEMSNNLKLKKMTNDNKNKAKTAFELGDNELANVAGGAAKTPAGGPGDGLGNDPNGVDPSTDPSLADAPQMDDPAANDPASRGLQGPVGSI